LNAALRQTLDPTVLAVAVCYGILLRLAAAAGFFGFWLGLLVMLSLWRYAYAVLRDAARGRQRIPAPGVETMNPVAEVALVLHFVLFAALTYVLFTTPLLGASPVVTALRYLGGAAVLAVFPASAAIMGITRNLGAAVAPAGIAHVIGVLRDRYVALLATAAALALTAGVLGALAGGFLRLLAYVVYTWLLLALFALIGAAVRTRGDVLDLPSDADLREERQQRDREREWQVALDRAYGTLRSGLVAEGYEAIRTLAASEQEAPEFYQWLFNRMMDWEDTRHAVAIGGRFIERLLDAGRTHDALELAGQCIRMSPALPLPPARIATLVAYARSIGRHRSADELTGAAHPVAADG
jgi:hypothetical protein